MHQSWRACLGACAASIVLLGGCAGAVQTPTAAQTGTAAAQQSAGSTAAASATAAAPAVSGDLAYIGFQGDDSPKSMAPFYGRTGVKMGATYVDSSEDIVTKLKVGGQGRYDFGTANQRVVGDLVAQNLIEPIDETKIPNLQYVLPQMKSAQGVPWAFADGKLYSIPLFWGFDVVNYRADLVTNPPSTWDDLLDAQYKGKICIFDNPIGGTLTVGQHLGLGSDGTKFTKANVETIKQWLLKLKANAKTYAKDYGELADLLIRGDCQLGWTGWEYISVKGQAAGVDIKHFVEGGRPVKAWADALVVAKGAPNRDAAYAWINEILDPKVLANAAQEVSSLVPETEAVQYMPASFASSMSFGSLEQSLTQLAWSAKPPATSSDPNQATLDDFTKMWEAVKAEG